MLQFSAFSAKEVNCESVQTRRVNEMKKILLKTCRMDETTVIDSDDFVFQKTDETINEVYTDYNFLIQYLPRNMYEQYPKLVSIRYLFLVHILLVFTLVCAFFSVWYCSLLAVSKDNFQKLTKLRRIALNHNKLKVIQNDTFEDLVNLEWLFLDNNKIIIVDGQAFVSLVKLNVLSLGQNKCINMNFYGEAAIKNMPTAVNYICSSYENYEICQSKLKNENDIATSLEKSVKTKIENCKIKN